MDFEKARLRVRQSYEKYYSDRKKKSLKCIKTPTTSETMVRVAKQSTRLRCEAINLNNKPCSNYAYCGKLCKKHFIPDIDRLQIC